MPQFLDDAHALVVMMDSIREMLWRTLSTVTVLGNAADASSFQLDDCY